MNVLVAGYEVDAHWSGIDLIVELDGEAVHSTPQAFQRDRERDRRLGALGYRVVRLTARQLNDDAGAVAADLGQLTASAMSTSSTYSPSTRNSPRNTPSSRNPHDS